MAGAIYKRTSAQVEGQKTGFSKLYLSPISEFLALQPNDTVTDPEDAYTISSDHTFGSGKGFAEIYVLPRQNTATGETFGEEGALNSLHKPKFFMPGDGPKTLAMVEALLNKELIVLQKDANTANGCVQYGDANVACFISSAGFNAATLMDGTRGYEFELVATSKYFYTGTITKLA